MKNHQTDPGNHLRKDQEHHHQLKKALRHQEDPAQNKEADQNNDDNGPHPKTLDHRPDNWKSNLPQHPKRN
jgi:hypothetical protein